MFGIKCGTVKMSGKMVNKVLSPDGKDSTLYKDILDYINKLDPEEKESIKDKYKEWEGDIVGDLDNNRHLALAVYAHSSSERMKESHSPINDNGEYSFADVKKVLIDSTPKNVIHQQSSTPGSELSQETKKKYEEFLHRTGFEVKQLSEGLTDKNGNKISSNATVDFIHRLISIAKGQDMAIGEETSHVAVRMIKEKDPALFKKMMNEVNKYEIYSGDNGVVNTYRNNPDYQLEDGKPNIPKLKEEAIGKIFNELVINRLEGTTEKPELLVKAQNWWDSVKQFFRGLVAKLGFDPSQDAIDTGAKQFTEDKGIFKDNVGTEDSSGKDTFHQQSVQDEIVNNLDKDIRLEKPEDTEGNSHYEIAGKTIKNRVTDISKKYLEGIFKNKAYLKDKIVEAINDQKKKFGIGGHKDIENILERGIDKDIHLRKDKIAYKDDNYTSNIDPKDEGDYNKLESYLYGYNDATGSHIPGLLDDTTTFPEGTKFYWEKMVYDPKRDLAGTIDFMAITPDGTTHLFDWKFIGSLEKNQSIRDYMKTSYDKQMDNYVDILKKNYGVKDIGQVRIIPISVRYSEKPGEEGTAVGLKIGTMDYLHTSDKEQYLLPYVTSSEKSKDDNVNVLVQRLTGLLNKIKSTSQDDDLNKQNKIHNIERALQFIRLGSSFVPYIEQAKGFINETHKKLAELNSKLPELKKGQIKFEDASDMVEPLHEMLSNLEIYQYMGDFSKYIYDEKDKTKSSKEARELADSLLEQGQRTRKLIKEVEKVQGKYYDTIFSGMTPQSILDPQKKLEAIGAWTRPSSKTQLTTGQAFWKINSYRQNVYEVKTYELTKQLEEIEEGLKTWGKGLSGKELLRKYQSLLEAKDDKGQGTNRLISQYNKDFYSELKKRTEKKEKSDEDIKWIKDNVDQEAFTKWMNDYKIERYAKVEEAFKYVNTLPEGSERSETLRRKGEMLNYIDSITNGSNFAYSQEQNIKKFPKTDIWYSKEYKELLKPENKQVKDYYDFIQQINEQAAEVGYIEQISKKTFLPWVEKSLAERVVLGGKWNVINKLVESISKPKNEGENEILDPVSGKLVLQLPKFFTQDLSTLDKEGKKDYSGVSDEMFKNVALFASKVIDYKAKKDVEELVKGLLVLEKAKGMLESTSKDKLTGRIVKEKSNEEFLDNMIKQMFYDKKTSDTKDIHGKTIIGEYGEEREISGVKTLNTIKTAYSLDVLGFNAVTSIFRTITTNLAGIVNADRYYTGKEMLQGLWDFSALRAMKNDHRVDIELMKIFMPVEENLHEGLNELSSSKATQVDFQATLMKLVKSAHNIVQYGNFLAHMKNSIILDGKLMNARDYYKNTPEYKERYNQSEGERLKLEKEFNAEVQKLIAENGLLKKAKFNEETKRLEIEGLDMTDFSVADLKSTIRVMGRKLSGNISENDESLMRSNFLIRQMFLFTNWLPQAIDMRFGGLAYNEGIDSYEYGRMRMMGRVLFKEGIIKGTKNLIDMYKANESGVEALHKLYVDKAAKYLEQTGQELKMSPEEFYDMVRSNIKAQTRELLSLLAVAGMVMGIYALAPKKDDDNYASTKGYWTFMKRIMNRCEDELGMFYNPGSVMKYADTAKFPMLGYLTSIKTAAESILKEGYGYATGDEDQVKKAHVIKNTFGTIPALKEGLEVISILDPEMAEHLGKHYDAEIGGYGKK